MFPIGGSGLNIIIFGVDINFSVHVYNTKKDISIRSQRSYTRIRWYYTNCIKRYSINFAATRTKFCLGLDYNGSNNYLFVDGTKTIKFKAKDSEIVATPLCPGNI